MTDIGSPRFAGVSKRFGGLQALYRRGNHITSGQVTG
jgi:hypothetical protein